MQFLKTLFWAVLAAVAVIFAYRNWNSVTIGLWGGLAADVKLPVLMLVSFLIGLLPALGLYYGTRWRMRRKVDNLQRMLAECRTELAHAGGVGDAAAVDPAVLPDANLPSNSSADHS